MNKIRWLIVVLVLVFISLPVSADDTVIWNNPKTINHAKLNMTAPQEFNTCVIAPDGTGGFDTCYAYIIVGNNFQHLPTGQLNFNSFWRKGNVRNVQYQYTKTWYDSVIIDNDSTTPIKVFSGFTSSVPQVNIGEYFAVKMVFEKRSYTSDFFDFTAQAGSDSITLDPDVAACGNLNTNDAIYTQIADISSATDCLTISGNNITFNGAGYEIYYNGGGVTGRGIILTGSNITVENATAIKNSAASIVNVEGIYINGGNGNNTIRNNSIIVNTTSGSSGIYINKRFNNVSFNRVVSQQKGIHIDTTGSDNIYFNNIINSSAQSLIISADNNSFYNNNVQGSDIAVNIGLGFNNITISGGDIQSNYTGATNDDYFINNIYYKFMVINKTNFTSRFIGYGGNNAHFNYTNGSDVFVDSRLSASKRSSRTLYNWTQSNITWSDNVTVTTATAFYNVSGLINNRHYKVYNNSYLNFTLLTNSSGVLPVFTMNLSINTINVTMLANNPPVITGISSSYTIDIGQPLTITPTITDADGDGLTNITNATLGSFDSSTGVLSFTPLNTQSGVYSWNITAIDSVGDSTTTDFTVIVNTPYKTACNNAGNDTNVAFGLLGVLLIITSAFGIIATIRGQNMVILVSFIGVGIFGSVLLVIGIFITSTISNGLC